MMTVVFTIVIIFILLAYRAFIQKIIKENILPDIAGSEKFRSFRKINGLILERTYFDVLQYIIPY